MKLITWFYFASCCIAFAQKGPSPESSLAKANDYYFKKEWTKAASLYQVALGDTSKSALLWQRNAYSNFMDKKMDISLALYKRALTLNPNPILKNIIQSQILTIYFIQKNSQAALAFLDEESRNGFNNLVLIDSIHVFDALRSSDKFKEINTRIVANAFPCTASPHRGDFDFWVGEWDVYKTGTDALVGYSRITKSPGGCSIIESWQSLVSPQTGHSINYFNPDKQSWEQVYVGSGGTVTFYTDGKFENEQMHFKYQSVFQGAPYSGNFIFYKQGNDQVRQYQDYTTDAGKTFTSTTDLTYKRKASR